MHRICLANSTRVARAERSHSNYWSGLNVCLFFVLLAVFLWAVHYRLAQYEAIQQSTTRVPAAKMWLGERNQMPLPATNHVDLAIVIFFNFAFASLLGTGESRGLWASLRSLAARFDSIPIRACLTHFFFLPPPAMCAA
jgi:hypothetical protein